MSVYDLVFSVSQNQVADNSPGDRLKQPLRVRVIFDAHLSKQLYSWNGFFRANSWLLTLHVPAMGVYDRVFSASQNHVVDNSAGDQPKQPLRVLICIRDL
jgi:hypothetical protein